MRLLLANKFYYRRGGDCIYTMNVEKMLKEKGHEVAVELCRQLPDFVFRKDIEEYLKPKKPRLRKLIEGAFSALVDSVKAWNNDEKRDQGVPKEGMAGNSGNGMSSGIWGAE